MAAPWTVGSIVARLQLDTSTFSRGLSFALNALRAFGTRVKTTISMIMLPFKMIGGIFGTITKHLFTIKGLLAGFAAYKIIHIAREAEQVRMAFMTLQESIGLSWQNTMKAIRVAVKGQLSDTDLQIAANEAVMLGIAQTTEQFELLATGARRLGKVMGIDVKDAFNQLTFGIGTQQTRMLRNLGIVVDLTSATEEYKRKLGGLNRELTENERRSAFAEKVFSIIQQKLSLLGADTENFTDALYYMEAQLTNVVSDFSEGLVPLLKKISGWVGQFAAKYLPLAKEFGAWISDFALSAFEVIDGIWERLSKGETTLGEIVFDLISRAWSLVRGPVAEAISAIAIFLAETFIAQFSFALSDKLADVVKDVEKTLGFGEAESPFKGLMGRGASGGRAAKDIAAQRAANERLAAAFENVQNEIKELAGAVGDAALDFVKFAAGEDVAKNVAERMATANDRLAASLKRVEEAVGDAEDAAKDFDKEIGKIPVSSDEADNALNSFTKEVRALQTAADDLNLTDAEKEIAKLARAYDELPIGEMSPGAAMEASMRYNEGVTAILKKQRTTLEREVGGEIEKARLDRLISGMSEIDKAMAQIEDRYRQAAAKLPEGQAESLRGLYDEYKHEVLLTIKEAQDREAWKGFGSTVSETLAGGIADGLRRGEKFSKVWADVTADLFGRALTDTIQRMSGVVGEALAKIMGELGAGAGFAGLGTGLLALAGTILGGLKSKKTATVDEFTNAINSSEAVRGLVAGPTNVAIAKVGDSLKGALRTTEVLLERIAAAVEAGSGARGGAPRNAAYTLTPTTAT